MSSSLPQIAVFLHDLRGGGAERAMLRLAVGMKEEGRNVVLVLVQAVGDYLQDVPDDLPLVNLNQSSVFGAIPALAKWIATNKPARILAALTHVNIAVIAAAKLARYKGPIFVSERNQISEKAAAARSMREKITYRLTPAAYRRCDGIIAVSNGVAQDLVSFAHLDQAKVHYVHNPVYDEKILARAAEAAPHPWLASADRASPVIIAVGRLHPQKDFPTLIKAFFELRAKRPARLIIFGEGSERALLERLVEGNAFAKDVSLPGFCKNPFAAMARADLQVLSSRWEGFPNVLVEGMSCGAAVVATDCPSGPQEILDGGRYGPLVPVGDVLGLSCAMAQALDNPQAGAIASERAKIFSVKNAARRYLELLAI